MELKQHQELYRQILSYIAPLLILLATPGNLTAAYVVVKSKVLWKNNYSVYILVLAIADTLVLYIGLGLVLLLKILRENNVAVPYTIAAGCEVLILNLAIWDSWVVVSLSIERLIAVFWPFQYKVWCTKTKTALGLTLAYFLSLSACLLCHQIYRYNFKLVSTVLYFLLIFGIPSACLIITSIATLLKIVYINKNKLNMNVQTVNMSHFTVTMLLVCVAFVALMGPYWCLQLYEMYYYTYYNTLLSHIHPVFRYSYLFSYLNYIVNFYIYSLTSPLFRKECKRLIFGLT